MGWDGGPRPPKGRRKGRRRFGERTKTPRGGRTDAEEDAERLLAATVKWAFEEIFLTFPMIGALPIIDGEVVSVGDFAQTLIGLFMLSKFISSVRIKMVRKDIFIVDATPRHKGSLILSPSLP